MAIPAIGNGRPVSFKTASARELIRAVSHVVEVEWAKFTLFSFSELGPFKKKKGHIYGL